MARSVVLRVFNNTGSTILGGTAVYQTGFDSELSLTYVAPADNTSENTMPAIGVAREDIASGEQGIVKKTGYVGNIDTSNYDPNTPVFVGTNGELVFSDPAASRTDVLSQQLGTVTRSDLNEGIIDLFPLEVRPKLRHEELTDVEVNQHHDQITASNVGQGAGVLKSLSGQKLSFRSIVGGGLGITVAVSGDTIVIDTAAGVGTVTGTGSAGQVAFWTGTSVLDGEANLYWDSGSDQLGIGTSTTNEMLTLEGVLSLREGLAPTSTSDYGKVYVKAADSKLYFMDDGGTEYDLTATGGGGGGLSETTFNENKTYWNDAISSIIKDLDGYTAGTGSSEKIAFWTGSNTLSFDSTLHWDDAFNRFGVGTASPNEKLTVEGVISLDETTAPGTTSGYGKIYVKSSDSKLYFKDDGGTEYDLTSGGGGGTPGGTDGQLQYNNSGAFGGANNVFWDDTSEELGIGTTTPASKLDVAINTATTDDIEDILTLTANTTGSVATGFGGSILFRGEFTGGSLTSMARISGLWESPAAGSVDSAITFGTRQNSSSVTERMRIDQAGFVGIGNTNPQEILHLNGAIIVGGASNTNNGTIRYTGSDLEGRVGGAWLSLTSVGGGGGLSETTFNENKLYWNEAIRHLIVAADGYSGGGGGGLSETTFNENKTFWNDAISTIRKDLDGYSTFSETTFNENKFAWNEAIHHIRESLDGYSTASGGLSETTFNENKKYWDDAIHHIRESVDGYASGTGSDTEIAFWNASGNITSDTDLSWSSGTNQLTVAAGAVTGTLLVGGPISLDFVSAPTSEIGSGKLYVKVDSKLYFKDEGGTEHDLLAAAADGLSETTFQENKKYWDETIHHIVESLDGYSGGGGGGLSETTFNENKTFWNDAISTIRKDLDGYSTGSGITATEGADGYVAFFTGPSGIAGDNDLFWDRANNRLGIHTTTPSSALHIVGNTQADGYLTSTSGASFADGVGVTLDGDVAFTIGKLNIDNSEATPVNVAHTVRIEAPAPETSTENAAIFIRPVQRPGEIDFTYGIYGEVSQNQDLVGGSFTKVVHRGKGDAHYVGIFGDTDGYSFGYESAMFKNAGHGFIATWQGSSGFPESVENQAAVIGFQALVHDNGVDPTTGGAWVTTTGLFHANNSLGNAFVTRVSEFANVGQPQFKLVDSDLRSLWSVFGSGEQHLISAEATSGTPQQNSPQLILRGHYFSGGEQIRQSSIQSIVDVTNKAQLRFSLGSSGAPTLVGLFTEESFRLLDGTVSLPALSFINDDNTGIYRSGADELTIAAAGADALRVYSTADVSIGGTNNNGKLTVEGAIAMATVTAPASSLGYGKIYVKSDNILYFKDESDTEYNLLSTGSDGLDQTTFNENKTYWNEAIHHITESLDGYSTFSETTFQENKKAWNDAIHHLAEAADGYVSGTGTNERVTFWTGTSTISSDADLTWNSGTNSLTIGSSGGTTALNVAGAISLDGGSVPSSEIGTGKLYVKSTDGLLYFKDEGDTEYSLTVTGAGLDEVTFQENKTFWNEAIHHITESLDGYSTFSETTFNENKAYWDETVEHIRESLDGYSASISGLDTTVQENKAATNNDIKAIIDVIDGYGLASDISGLNTTFNENKTATDNDIKAIVDVIDGYTTGTGVNERVAFWTGTSSLSSDADLIWNSGTNALTIGSSGGTTALNVAGAISLDGGTAPSSEIGTGKIYVKSADGLLYFKDEGDTEYSLTVTGGGLDETTFQENKEFWNETIKTIRKDLDGYSTFNETTFQENKEFWNNAISSIRKDLDGYSTFSETTFQENKAYWDNALDTIRKDLDGYSTFSETTFQENKTFWNDAIHHLTEAVDGYAAGTGVNERITFWTGTSTISSDADLVWNSGTNSLTIGSSGGTTALNVAGSISLDGGSVPSSEIGTGKLYVKSTDGLLYFKDEGDTEYSLTATADPGVNETTFQENKTYWNDALSTIRKDLDGYGSSNIVATEGADGYITFFTGSQSIAGDNDLFWNRPLNRLEVDGYIIPTSDNIHGLGLPTNRWRDLFLGPDSLNIVSTPAETGKEYRWTIGIDKTTGNTGNLVIGQGQTTFFTINKSGEVELDVPTAKVVKLEEQGTSPTDETGFGKLFTKTDSKLYFRDDSGTEFDLTADVTGVSENTFNENKKYWNDAVHHITESLDGYSTFSEATFQENKEFWNDAISTIRKGLDGYSTDTLPASGANGGVLTFNGASWVAQPSLGGPPSAGAILVHDGTNWNFQASGPTTNDVLTWNGSAWVGQAPAGGGGVSETTFNQNKKFWNEAIRHLTEAADGYSVPPGGVSQTTFNENKAFWNDAIHHITESLDGYSTFSETTFNENKFAWNEAIHHLTEAADGYALQSALDTTNTNIDNLDQTVSEHYDQHSDAIQTILKDLDGYSTFSETTFQENKFAWDEAIRHLRAAADGYSGGGGGVSEATFQENKAYWDEAIHHLIEAADGYSGGGGGVSEATFNENKAYWNEAIHHLVEAADGYSGAGGGGLDETTFQENKEFWNESIKTIRKDLDGYALQSDLDTTNTNLSGLDQTVTEHYAQNSQAIQSILKDLDGYSTFSETTFNENKAYWDEAIHHLTEAADGYSGGGSGLSEVTFNENKKAWNEAIHHLTEAADGYIASPGSPSTGAVLTYNGTNWIAEPAGAPSTGALLVYNGGWNYQGGGATTNQVLTWNGISWAPATPASGSGVSETTFNQNKKYWNETIHHIVENLDGYSTFSETTFNENKKAWNDAIHHLTEAADGYTGNTGDVTKVGTPVDDQLGVWTGDGTIEGTTQLTYSGGVLNVDLDQAGQTRLDVTNQSSSSSARAILKLITNGTDLAITGYSTAATGTFGGISRADAIYMRTSGSAQASSLMIGSANIGSPGAPVHIMTSDQPRLTITSTSDNNTARIGVATTSPNEILTVEGAISLDEVSAPSTSTGYGKIYVGTDSELHFLDDSSNDTQITNAGSVNGGGGGGGLDETTFNENKNAWNEAIHHLTEAADGYLAAPSSPSSGSLIAYNGTSWVAQPAGAASSGALLSYTGGSWGYIGLGATTSDVLTWNGVSWVPQAAPSDERLKRNITDISGALEKVNAMRGVNFEWKEEAKDYAKNYKTGVPQIGLIAQDVEKVLPELIKDRKGYKIIQYDKLHGVLVEAIKDLTKMVKDLTERVEKLEK